MWLKVLFVAFASVCLTSALPSIFSSSKAGETKCGFESCHKTKPGMLNVHLVPHTHDDVGWLKTVDQYYYGSNGGIQKASVQYIIDSVIQSLLESSERRFVYVESAFFSKWWKEQTDALKEEVKMLVNEGRLEFIGGAWSMNDEATTHYQSIVDQFALGTRFLNETFGECARPRIGWQIDPFGHSREQASLFAKMGYDGIFFARLDYQDKNKRKADKSMEMIWKASQNLDDSDIFTSALYNHYSAPSGFCFDILCNDEPIIDDPKSFDYNVDRRIEDFVKFVENQRTSFKSDNVILTMGDDFHFMNAGMYFKNLDKLIKYTNERQSEFNVNVIYSTPSCYLKALHEADIEWPTKSDDFMPYSNDPHAFWTGYYTSRPTSKRFERMGNQFLQVCKQLTATANLTETVYEKNLGRMKEEMGVMQHHDAVTGTEKQHVADDYHRELTQSFLACDDNTKASLKQLINKPEQAAYDFKFVSCLNLNISDCSVSEKSEKFIVNVYNPLSHPTNQFIRIPVIASNYEVRDSSNVIVASQLLPVPSSIKSLPNRPADGAMNELVFKTSDVPALGYKSYYVTRTTTSYVEPTPTTVNPLKIGSDSFSVTFDSNGLLSSVSVDGEDFAVKQNFLYYKGAMGNNQIFANRSSGAYIFRPDPLDGNAHEVATRATLLTYKGEQIDEVHQVFNEWISQVVRIYKNLGYVELEWLVGSIPVEDNIGKEIISRFTTSMQTKGTFETDSNGREMLTRTRGHRDTWEIQLEEPVSGNYYPINTKISIEDATHRLSLLTDRAQGGSSILDGTVELMVHRRLLRDDAFGVGEALNETHSGTGLVARGKHWLVFGKKSTVTPTLKGRERILQNEMLMSNWLFFDSTSESSSDWSTKYTNSRSAIGLSLPENVYLMTYEPWTDNSFLVRFEHIMEKNEDSDLSLPITFDLSQVFNQHNFEFSETNLAGNQWIDHMDRLQFKKIGDTSKTLKKAKKSLSKHEDVLTDTQITLHPMQIRTFVMKLSSKEKGGKEGNHGMKSQVAFVYFILIVSASILKMIL